MLKVWGHVGGERARARFAVRVCSVLLFMAVGSSEPRALLIGAANGQEQESRGPSATQRTSNTDAVTSQDDVDLGSGGNSNASRSDTSDSLLTAITNASGPVVIVTVVIAAM